MHFDRGLHLCNHYLSQDVEYLHHSGECPLTFPFFASPSPTQITTVVIPPTLINLPVPELQVRRMFSQSFASDFFDLQLFEILHSVTSLSVRFFHCLVWIAHNLFILSPLEVCCFQQTGLFPVTCYCE